jgi:hypothetical protein
MGGARDRAFLYQEPTPKKVLSFQNYARVRHNMESDEITALSNRELKTLENDYKRYRRKELKLSRV